MHRGSGKTNRGPMIHIRLDEKTHRELKILAVTSGSTIQGVVEKLIKLTIVKNRTANRITDRARKSS